MSTGGGSEIWAGHKITPCGVGFERAETGDLCRIDFEPNGWLLNASEVCRR
jgi:hypothetical protein